VPAERGVADAGPPGDLVQRGAGDVSASRYTLRGTDIASGRSYEVTGLDMIRVREGRLVEHWALLGSSAMRHQLGAG
jgi:ketosteroid isomerase-like protein